MISCMPVHWSTVEVSRCFIGQHKIQTARWALTSMSKKPVRIYLVELTTRSAMICGTLVFFFFCIFCMLFFKTRVILLPPPPASPPWVDPPLPPPHPWVHSAAAAFILLKTKPEALGGPAAKAPVVNKNPQEVAVEQIRSKKAAVRFTFLTVGGTICSKGPY